MANFSRGIRVHRPQAFVLKEYERIIVILLLMATFVALAVALIAVRMAWPSSGKWFSTAGLVVALAGLFQLDHSGFFGKLTEVCGDAKKYPYGPPSYVNREIIASVETPLKTRLNNILFYHPRTGFHLVVGGAIQQIVSTWL